MLQIYWSSSSIQFTFNMYFRTIDNEGGKKMKVEVPSNIPSIAF
jgi:hypothetical protein